MGKEQDHAQKQVTNYDWHDIRKNSLNYVRNVSREKQNTGEESGNCNRVQYIAWS